MDTFFCFSLHSLVEAVAGEGGRQESRGQRGRGEGEEEEEEEGKLKKKEEE